MKKLLINKATAATVLVLILAFSVLFTNILPVMADVPGIGKYLTVEIQGEGFATATKVNSGAVWTYTKTYPPTQHKLGAGTVSLEASAHEGWRFLHWEDFNGNVVDTRNPFSFKTEKYAYLRAVFVKLTFTITAIVYSEAPSGTITTDVNGETQEATSVQSLKVTVESGGSQTFTFNPFEDNHVSAIQIDGVFVEYTPTYTFSAVQGDHTLTIYFSLDGEAYVPAGSNVPVFLGGNVGLNFVSTQGGGTATQAEILLLTTLLQGTSLILWDVSVGVSFTGVVEITLPYASSQPITSVWTSDSLDALYSDVNGDGVVNGDDSSDVANAIKTLVPHGSYDAAYDVNRDGILSEDDIHVVNQNKGTVLQSLTFTVEGTTLFIQTDHFSIFRGR